MSTSQHQHLTIPAMSPQASQANGDAFASGQNGVSPEAQVTNGHTSHPLVEFNPAPGYTPSRKLRVVTIGAGYSGLTLAHKLQHQHPEMQDLIEHTIFEARAEIGGTWLVNTYPGVVCDVPSHIYVRIR